VFSIVELKATALEYGIPGVSPAHMVLLFLIAFSIPMIPYLLLYLSLKASPTLKLVNTFGKFTAWVHAHGHPELLHH
jgi:hypothetical protein